MRAEGSSIDERAVGRLELRHDPDGARHYLLGRPLTSGDVIEVLTKGGVWLRGAYEWRGLEHQWPGLRVLLESPWESWSSYEPSLVAPLHPSAAVRWADG